MHSPRMSCSYFRRAKYAPAWHNSLSLGNLVNSINFPSRLCYGIQIYRRVYSNGLGFRCHPTWLYLNTSSSPSSSLARRHYRLCLATLVCNACRCICYTKNNWARSPYCWRWSLSAGSGYCRIFNAALTPQLHSDLSVATCQITSNLRSVSPAASVNPAIIFNATLAYFSKGFFVSLFYQGLR